MSKINVKSLNDGVSWICLDPEKNQCMTGRGTILDFENHAEITDEIIGYVSNENSKVVFDISNIDVMDSSGISAILEIHKKGMDNKNKVCFLKSKEDKAYLVERLNVDQTLNMFNSEQEAIAFLNN